MDKPQIQRDIESVIREFNFRHYQCLNMDWTEDLSAAITNAIQDAFVNMQFEEIIEGAK